MPVIEVELPDGSIAEFPDDMAQDKISEAVQTHLKEQTPDQEGYTPRQRRTQAMAEQIHPRALTMTREGDLVPAPENQPGIIPATLQSIITSRAVKRPEDTFLTEALNQPLTQLLPQKVQDEGRQAVQDAAKNFILPGGGLLEKVLPKAVSQTASGVAKGVTDTAESFTSPLGIATMTAKAPAALQRLISAAFAFTSGKEAAGDMQPLADAVQNKDWETAARLATAKLGGAAVAVAAGTHALAPDTVPARLATPEVASEPTPVPPVIEQAKSAGLPRAAAEAAKTLAEKGGETDASKNKETTEVHGDVREQPGEGKREVPKQVGGEGIQPSGKEPETPADVVLKPPEITDEHLTQTDATGKPIGAIGNKPAVAASYFRTWGDKATKPDMWVQFFQDLNSKRDKLYPQETAYQIGLYLRQLGQEKAQPVIDALMQARDKIIADAKSSKAEHGPNVEAMFKDPRYQLGLVAQFPREAVEAAHDEGSAIGKVSNEIEEPLKRAQAKEVSPNAKEEEKEGDEVLTPAVKTDEGVFSGQKRHNDIVLDQAKNGVDATGGERGFLHKGKFIDRAEAARIYEEQTGRKPANAGELHSEDLLDSGYFKEKSGQSAVVDQSVKKVAKQVKKVAATEGQRPAKEVKTELVSRVEDALEEAKPESDYLKNETVKVTSGQFVNGKPITSDVALIDAHKPSKSGETPKFHKEYLDALQRNAPKITIDIPGDGKFTIHNTKEALTEMLYRAKRLETTPGKPVSVSKSGISKADKEWIAAQKAQSEPQPIGAGPGAATRPGAVLQTDIGAMETNIPPLEKLADAVSRFPKQSGGGFREKLRQWMDDVGIPTKDFATRALVGAKAATSNIVNAFTKLAKVTTMDRAVGDWNLADTEGDIAARRFAKAVKDRFPDRSKLRAFSNWINAGGDKELLQRQADLTKDPELKKTYTDALKFGPEEERLGSEIKQYHDEMLAEAMRAGALEEGLENYIHRYYPRETDPARQRLEGALNEMRFTKNFSGFKKRFYDSDFEAEQAGLKPEKDAAKRILAYDQGFRKALTARAFVKDRYKATMPDGRPEIDVTGIGVPSRTDVDTGKETPYLVKPKSKAGGDSPEDYRGDYVTFDHPAFRRWKWVGQDANGNPILMEGEMAVHPDAVKKYRALFERSWFQKNPLGKALLIPSNFVKQTMLALSAFHPVQIGIHAIEHKVNPFKLTDLNTRDPAQAELIKGGLTVADLDGGSHFSEGVAGSGLFGKIPIAGEMIKSSQDWLFKDFIPRIKMTMALDALERNRKSYAKDVASGKITDEQLVRMTARQSNAAFGEQNYRAMFRHKGFQDVLRFAFLAPDFGEARLRFPLQAATKYGGEQRMALMMGAVGMFVAAKTAEKLMTGNMNLNKPFTVTVNNREYGLRNVASDLYHMITDPAGYLRNRLNPIYTRPALEMLSGRDAFGRKRTAGQQVLDEAKQIVPISARGAVEKDQSLWESFINAIGLTEHRASAFGQAMQAVNKWKQKKGYTEPGEFVYDADKDPYSKLTTALTYGSPGDARKQLDALTEGKTPLEARKIAAHYRRSLAEHPFLTGSRAHEQEYVKQLDSAGKAQYDEAKAERKAMWQKFIKAWRSKFPATQ